MTEAEAGTVDLRALFTDEDLGLIRRVLTFAIYDVPIQDVMGNKIYPIESTRKHAQKLENHLDNLGVQIPKGLFTAFDPYEVRDKIATARYTDPNGYEHNIKGLVTGVEQLEDQTWSLRMGPTEFFYKDVEEFKNNISVELTQ